MPDYNSITDLMNGTTSQDASMASLLDSPEMRRRRAFDTLGGIGAALIQAGTPSVTPRSFTDIFASGIGGGVQGQAGNEDKYLKHALVASQVQTANQKLKQQDAWAKLLNGPAPTAGAPAAAPITDPTNPGNYQPTLAIAEGGNGPGAATIVNPQSGAGGQFQFMPSTWNDVRTRNPDLNLPQSPLDAPPELQAKAEERFRASNAAELQKAGIPPTPANLYLAHRAGAQGAQTILGAPPETPMAQLVPPTWLQQNPDMNTTAGQFRHQAEQRFGQPTQAPPQGGTALPAGMPQQAVPPVAAAGAPPQSIQEVLQKVPPGVRQILGAIPMEQSLPLVMKYAEPNHQIAMDTRTGQVIFADKNDIGRLPYLVPVDAAKLQLEQQKTALDKQRTEGTLRNQDVILGPDDKPVINQPLIAAKKEISAAQGTDVSGHADKAMIDQSIKEHGELQNNALQARTGIAQTQRLGSLLDQINTGKFTSTTQEVLKTAKGLGFDLQALGITDKTGVAEAADALSKQLALSLRNPSQGAGMPGAMSDADRNFLAKMVPTLETQPEGRKLMAEYATKMYQRSIDVAKIANDWMRSGKIKTDPAGMYAEIQKYADEHPLFSPKDLPSGGMTPIPQPPPGFSMPGGGGSAVPPPPAGFKPL